jgi:flavin reductase (DIM6/NTAB) family NADH-FMN oxidoreductase RutF
MMATSMGQFYNLDRFYRVSSRMATVEPGQLRATMGHFATGVTVVTAADRRGRPFGSTANAVSSVSLDPPLIMVSLRNESETLTVLLETGCFAVNVLHEGQEELASRFARRAADLWDGVRWGLRDGGAPVLDGALATLECKVHDIADGGDHRIVVGRVADVEHPEDHVPPLVFYRGAYSRLAPERAPAPDVTRLPSRLGDLAMVPLELGDADLTSVAVLVGRPQGSHGCLVHVHHGCVVGDALRGAHCRRRQALDAALEQMSVEGRGVVVYHRDERRAFASCCLGDDAPDDDLAERAFALAVEQLDLRDPRRPVRR